MGPLRSRGRATRGWAVRWLAATLISVLVGPGPLVAWAHARDAEQAANARLEERLREMTEGSREESTSLPLARSAPQRLPVRSSAASAEEILPVPLQPKDVRLLGAHSNADPWSLFDGKASTGLTLDSSAPVRLAIELSQPQALSAITLLGSSEGSLSVFAQQGNQLRPIQGLQEVQVRASEEQWRRFPVEDRTVLSRLILEWVPASTQGPLEIGLWGRSLPLRDATDTELADRILSSSAPGALVVKATPDLVTASRVSLGSGADSKPRAGVVHLHLAAEPRSWSRAFLVYELTGLGHFTQAIRQINGLTPQGGARAVSDPERQAEGGLQVEEIAPDWLRQGDNEIRFLPLPDAGANEYSVRKVSVVAVGHASLTEARIANGETGRASQLVAFERPSQPHDLVFELLERSAGNLLVRSAGDAGRAPLRVDLRGLSPGWHQVDLGALPPTRGLSVALDRAAGGGRVLRDGVLPALSEVAVTASAVPSAADAQRIGVSYPLHGECRDGQAWIQGFVAIERGDAVVSLRANGEDLTSAVGIDNSFTLRVAQPRKKPNTWAAKLEATLASGRKVERSVRLEPCFDSALIANGDTRLDEGAPYEQLVRAGEKKTLTFAGATLEIPAGAVERDTRISIRPLVAEQVPAMTSRVSNVSPGQRGFRFGPHGLKFKKPVKLTLPYDSAAFAQGVTEREVFAFYYDEPLQSWQRIGRYDTARAGVLTSLTDHFTDFITGVLAMPDAPGLKSFNANEMKGIKMADPAAGLSLIAPPAPNPGGSMNLQYPIEVPPGRNGVQPSLAFTYNSSATNGWLGMGWDLRVSSIELDTRFGVPRYDDALDRVDRYTLDGDRLVVAPGGDNNNFVRRVEGRFDKIHRNLTTIGSKSCVTSWTVTDKQGVVYTYGGSGAALVQPGEACNVSRWGLSKVQDAFGNQMLVSYFTDSNPAAGEPFTALYPEQITYTSHVGAPVLAAAYRVKFVRDAGNVRQDVVISGRAGFQERTRFRLDHVDVELLNGASSTLIRRYQLAYHAPTLTHFYKSLLASIGQQGLGAVTELDRHTFEYGEAATTAGGNVISGFGPPTPWGSAQGGYALSHVDDEMAGGSVTLGVGLPIISLSATGGANGGAETLNRALLDLNGDGLPDLGASSGAYMNYLRPDKSIPGASPNDPHLAFQSVSGFGSLGHSNKSGWNVGAGLGVAIVAANVGYSSTSTDDNVVLTDINGDGLVDRASVLSGKLRWAKNKGNNQFELQPEAMNSTVLTNSTDPNGDFLSSAATSGQLARINPVVRWKAPFPIANAAVTIRGAITKLVAGGNGVDVYIYKNATPLWSRTISPSDLTSCTPTPMATPSMLLTGGCDAGSTGLPVTVNEGDSLYFITAPHHDPSGSVEQVSLEGSSNQVTWDPSVTYDGKPALLEPYGLPVYQFSQKTDHRLFRPEVQWVASAKGTVHLQQRPWQASSLPNKRSISDTMTLRITHRSGSTGAVVGTPIDIPVGAAAAASPIALDQAIDVEKGDSVAIEAFSTTPVDINRLGLDLWMVYSHYYRNLSSSNATYDGDITCSRSAADQPIQCVMAGDPEADSPIPADILAQPIHVSYRFNQLKGAATQVLATPAAQTSNLTGTVNCSGVTAGTTVLVQGVNQLYAKQAVPDLDGAGNGSTSFNVPVTSEAGGELMVTAYSDQSTTSCTGSASWNGSSVPVTFKYADPSFYAVNPDQTPIDPMSGGFHRWSVGFLNGDLGGFAPSQIVFPVNGSGSPTHDPTWFFFGVPQHEEFPPVERPAGRWSGPGGAYVAAGEFRATRGSTRVAGGGGGGGLDSLRHASTWNFELSAGISFGVGGTFAVNQGRTKNDLDFFDFNGDRYPDIISADGTVQYGDGNGGLSPRTVSGVKDLGGLREIHHGTVRVTASTGDVHLLNDVATDGSVRKSISTGFNFGTDYGLSSTTTDWVDVNGDGLPDAVQRTASDGSPNTPRDFSVRLNYGYRLGPPIAWPANSWSTASTGAVPGVAAQLGVTIDSAAIGDLVNAVGGNVGINGVRLQDNASNNVNIGGNVGIGNNLSIGGGGGFSFGFGRTMVDMVDMNGDGLPDQVMRIANDPQGQVLRVRLNLGDRFDTVDTLWSNPNWGNIDDGGVDFSFAGSNAINDALGFRRSKSFTASFQFKVCFILCVGASAFSEHGSGWAYSAFEDVDGDGRQDMVFKNRDTGQVTVKLNQTPKDLNLLKKVNRPLGGSFEFAYDRAGNLVRRDLAPVVDDPGNKFVMATVSVSDGRGNQYWQRFDYGTAGYFDRTERQDYGFAKMTSSRLKQDGVTPYSLTEIDYHNQDFYRRGRPARVVVRAADARVFSVRKFDYATSGYGPCASAVPDYSSFPAERTRSTGIFEGTVTNPDATAPVATSEARTWDCHGNLTDFADSGEAKDMTAAAAAPVNNDIRYHIDYATTPALVDANIYKPIRITAKDHFNKVLRDRRATYEAHGALQTLTDVVVGGVDPITQIPNTGDPATNPKWTYLYDAFGNVKKAVDPRGYTIEYQFDEKTRTYRTLTEDSFGYGSSSVPDLRFGTVAQQMDVNGSLADFHYDEFGRLSSVDGPFDVGTSHHTISFAYSEVGAPVAGGVPPSNPAVPYAVTSHLDVQHPNQPILTSTFIDGLARVIQTKKSSAKDTGSGPQIGMQVSGDVKFDEQGRPSERYQAYFEASTQPTTLSSLATYPAVFTEFDELDRPIVAKSPRGFSSSGTDPYTWAKTTVSYGIGAINGVSRLSTVTSDPNVNATLEGGSPQPGFQRTVLRGVRGNVLQTIELNRLAGGGAASQLKTTYGYDALEQLASVTDAKGNVTRATYDTMGRIVTLLSPDMGRTDFQFDLSGNLAAKQTAKLADDWQFVRYDYEFNRLTRIDNPNSPDVTFEYGSPYDAGPLGLNRAGRIMQETSEAGVKEFKYDAMGNVNEENWSLNRLGPNTDPIERTFMYDYDSFGRLLSVYYPGASAEVVSYGYDAGGNLDTVTGVTASHQQTPYVQHIGYNEFAQRTVVTVGNGITTTYSYDPLTRRLAGIQASQRDPALVAAGAPARSFQQLAYQYDPVGNLTQIANTAPVDPTQTGTVKVGPVTENFTYDDLYQLRTADGLHQSSPTNRFHYGLSFTYDAVSNITQKAQLSETQTLSGGTVTQTTTRANQTYTSNYKYIAGRPHAPSEISDTVPGSSTPSIRNFSYDANGNQTSFQRVTGTPTTRSMTYDDSDRLTNVAQDGVGLQSALYDANGQRLVKLANESSVTAYFGKYLTVRDTNPITKHIYAGDVLVASKFVPSEANEECAACTDHASVTYFHADQLGSISFATDESQALLAHEQYFPSGELWVDQATDTAHTRQPFLFAGKELDAETSLYYFGARYYDPRLGVWTSPDPMLTQYLRGNGNGGVYVPRNLNSYGYSWNNPVTLTDPDGRMPQALLGALIGFGVELAIQVYTDNYSLTRLGVATGAGALSGGLSAFIGGAVVGGSAGAIATRVALNSVGNGAIGAVQEAANQAYTGQPTNDDAIWHAAKIGMLGGFFGSAGGEVVDATVGTAAKQAALGGLSAGERNLLDGMAKTTASATRKTAQPTITTVADVVSNGTGPLIGAGDTLNSNSASASPMPASDTGTGSPTVTTAPHDVAPRGRASRRELEAEKQFYNLYGPRNGATSPKPKKH